MRDEGIVAWHRRRGAAGTRWLSCCCFGPCKITYVISSKEFLTSYVKFFQHFPFTWDLDYFQSQALAQWFLSNRFDSKDVLTESLFYRSFVSFYSF